MAFQVKNDLAKCKSFCYTRRGVLVTKSSPTLETPWTVALAPLSMGFPRQDTGVDSHFLLQGIFLT